jgi:hypothetical protein
VNALFKAHQVPLNYSDVDLENDLAARRALGILRDR